jgi:hypothetical protein
MTMTDDQAKEIASGLTGNSDYYSPDVRGIARSLKALIPELGDPWGVVELRPILDTEESAYPWLLFLVSEGGLSPTLWTASIVSAADPKYEWPKLMVQRFGTLQWGVSMISDTLHPGDGAAEAVLRAYLLRIGDDRYAFTTDEIVGSPPSRLEQFGRDLAAAKDWPITSVEPENL